MSPLPKRRLRRGVAGLAAVIVAGFVVNTGPSASAGSGPIQYTFDFVNGITVSGTSDSNTAFLAGAGGSSADAPTGMNVHVSCSDSFPGGWGEKDGPDQVADSAWQIRSYTIQKLDDKGQVSKTCSDSFVPPTPVGDPDVDIEMYVNDEDADEPTGPQVDIGSTVRFSYVVTNTGAIPLQEVAVDDADRGAVECPKDALAVGESMTCTEKTAEADRAGQQDGSARVDAIGLVGAPRLEDTIPPSGKGMLYRFSFVNGAVVTGTADSNTVFVADAGGPSADDPTGMNMHVSCSDPFTGGWGVKDGPNQAVDTAWQIESYEIIKYKDGKVDKRCGEPGAQVRQPVSDEDPVHYIVESQTVVGGEAAIDIEEYVNRTSESYFAGVDADEPTGPVYEVGTSLRLRYVVTNTGDVLLTGVKVTDSELGVKCDVPNLGPGGSYSCPSVVVKPTVPGQVTRAATVTGKAPDGEVVMDTDPVNYLVAGGTTVADVDIEEYVNLAGEDYFGGVDADVPTGPSYGVGQVVRLRYVVTNTGDSLLTGLKVTDSELGVKCDVPNLGPGGSYSCPSVFVTLGATGQVTRSATVTGTAPDGVTVTDTDPVNYRVSDSVN